jgi:4-amino-4-deoxy-L-arabinose transferase-like glycosyltransferase
VIYRLMPSSSEERLSPLRGRERSEAATPSVRTRAAWMKSHWPLGAVLGVLGLLIVVINPLREVPYEDDWSYTLMVRHLLETGHYQVDNWSAANPVSHIYWGALFARLFGFSFASLRISTLVLLAAGLCGMYMLAREHRLSARQAGMVTFVLLVSPLTLLVGFSYMTDIPYLACIVLGLAFYTRALRLNSYAWAFAGSVFASAAILNRTFGVAFVPGLALVWLLTSRKRNTLWLFLTAMALPLLAVGWQLLANAGTPNWAIPLHMEWQRAYVTNMHRLPPEMFWRLAVTLEYLALFSLPLIPVAMAEWWHSLKSRSTQTPGPGRYWRNSAMGALVVAVIFLAAANFVGVKFLEPSATGPGRPPPGWVMPIIGWCFDLIAKYSFVAVGITVAVFVGAAFYGRAIILRYASGSWREIRSHEALLDSVTLFLVILQITYFQFFDRYLLPLLPFVLIVVARRAGDCLDRFARHTLALVLAAMVVVSLYVRAHLAYYEDVWASSNNLVAQGVPAQQISSSWEWAFYHGAFDDYLRAYDGHPPGVDPREHFYRAWFKRMTTTAPYFMDPNELKGSHVQLISTMSYRDLLLRERTVHVYKRLP